MSMLKSLKETSKSENSFFVEVEDEEIDVDNMDFPLPDVKAESNTISAQEGKQLQQESLAGKAIMQTPEGMRVIDPSVFKRWVCIYPCYIDATKTVEGGRRIPKEKAFKSPNGFHIAHAAKRLGLSVIFEGNKKHPRDWANPGRVRVELKRNDYFVNPTIVSRKELMCRIVELLPSITVQVSLPDNFITPLTTLTEIQRIAGVLQGGSGPLGLPSSSNSGTDSPNSSTNLSSTKKNETKEAKKPKRAKKVIVRV